MAGDWIPMRVDLADDPAVVGIAATLGMDEDLVVGKLHRLWSWANRQTKDGCARSVTAAFLNRKVRAEGFAEAMCAAQWLTVTDDGIRFPRFNRWNSQPAKTRLLAAKRMAKTRCARVAPRAQQKRNQSRVEKRRVLKAAAQPSAAAAGLELLVERWNSIPGVRPCKVASRKRATAYRQRLSESGWEANLDEALAAVATSRFCQGGGSRGWKADLDWLLRPDTVTKLLEGKYNDSDGGSPARVRQRKFSEYGDRHYRDDDAAALQAEDPPRAETGS